MLVGAAETGRDPRDEEITRDPGPQTPAPAPRNEGAPGAYPGRGGDRRPQPSLSPTGRGDP